MSICATKEGKAVSIFFRLDSKEELLILLKVNSPQFLNIAASLSLIFDPHKIELIELIKESSKFFISNLKFVVLPGLRRVEAAPSIDLIENHSNS